jgi:hypothetical protein
VSRGPSDIPSFRKRFARKRSKSAATRIEKVRGLFRAGTPQEVTSTRAKSQRHRKVTADRWNQ